MRRLILFIMLGWGSQPLLAEDLEWLTDAQAAKEQAKQENKYVLLDFTGSDWCGWCMRLKTEVFDKPEFAEFARAKLVLVEVDFPRRKEIANAQKQANAELAQTYHITGYPTLIVLNQDGKPAGRLGYVPGGPTALIDKLERAARINKTPAAPPPDPEPAPAPRKPVKWTPPPPPPPTHYGPHGADQ